MCLITGTHKITIIVVCCSLNYGLLTQLTFVVPLIDVVTFAVLILVSVRLFPSQLLEFNLLDRLCQMTTSCFMIGMSGFSHKQSKLRFEWIL